MLVIKTLNDARTFIEYFNTYAETDVNNGNRVFTFENGSLFGGVKPGKTNFYRKNGKYYHYNYGQNWHDKSADEVDEPHKFVWNNRKWINAQLKRNNEID